MCDWVFISAFLQIANTCYGNSLKNLSDDTVTVDGNEKCSNFDSIWSFYFKRIYVCKNCYITYGNIRIAGSKIQNWDLFIFKSFWFYD